MTIDKPILKLKSGETYTAEDTDLWVDYDSMLEYYPELKKSTIAKFKQVYRNEPALVRVEGRTPYINLSILQRIQNDRLDRITEVLNLYDEYKKVKRKVPRDLRLTEIETQFCSYGISSLSMDKSILAFNKDGGRTKAMLGKLQRILHIVEAMEYD